MKMNILKQFFGLVFLIFAFLITVSAQDEKVPPKEKPPIITPGEKKGRKNKSAEKKTIRIKYYYKKRKSKTKKLRKHRT